jgi:hypothetical protein
MRKRGLATGMGNLCPACVSGAISGSTGQELWNGLPKRKTIQSEVTGVREADPRVSRKDRIQLFPNIVSVENLDTSDFPGDNVKNQHPNFRYQADIPVTGTEASLRLRLGVERTADVVTAATAVENSQFRHLCSKFGFALLFQKLAKLGCQLREHDREGMLFFGLFIHGITAQLWLSYVGGCSNQPLPSPLYKERVAR